MTMFKQLGDGESKEMKLPKGILMMLKSFGFNPDEIAKQINGSISTVTNVLESIDTQLKTINARIDLIEKQLKEFTVEEFTNGELDSGKPN